MTFLNIYAPRIVQEVMGPKVYHLVKVLSFYSPRDSTVGSELRRLKLKDLETGLIWHDDFVKGVKGLDEYVEELFRSKEIGLVYFVNNQEPDLSVEDAKIKKGDHILLAYIDKNWRKRK
jgi:hypothetical protein